MKVKDFEKAIEALGCVTIDAFNLRRGQVRMCLAHTDNDLLKFDGWGRAFSAGKVHTPVCREDHEVYDEDEYDVRMPAFDLRFKFE